MLAPKKSSIDGLKKAKYYHLGQLLSPVWIYLFVTGGFAHVIRCI